MDGIWTFLGMGGYAVYVWPALGISALVLAGLWLGTVRTIRQRRAHLTRLQRQAGGGGTGEPDSAPQRAEA